MSTFVVMCKPEFAPAIKAGTKCRTVRPKGKRTYKAGDVLMFQQWTGKPYRSKREPVKDVVVERVSEVMMSKLTLSINGQDMAETEVEAFATADGFKDAKAMREFFEREHGFPFEGHMMVWNPDRKPEPKARTTAPKSDVPFGNCKPRSEWKKPVRRLRARVVAETCVVGGKYIFEMQSDGVHVRKPKARKSKERVLSFKELANLARTQPELFT